MRCCTGSRRAAAGGCCPMTCRHGDRAADRGPPSSRAPVQLEEGLQLVGLLIAANRCRTAARWWRNRRRPGVILSACAISHPNAATGAGSACSWCSGCWSRCRSCLEPTTANKAWRANASCSLRATSPLWPVTTGAGGGCRVGCASSNGMGDGGSGVSGRPGTPPDPWLPSSQPPGPFRTGDAFKEQCGFVARGQRGAVVAVDLAGACTPGSRRPHSEAADLRWRSGGWR
jgi:hypothetical protein